MQCENPCWRSPVTPAPRRTRKARGEAHAISALSALAQPTRLAIFRLLIKHEPVGITAGVIADTVGAPHNTLSSHLAILVRAGLLRSAREGRTIVYRSDVDGMQTLCRSWSTIAATDILNCAIWWLRMPRGVLRARWINKAEEQNAGGESAKIATSEAGS